jgi:Asp-tRNA(Asn)/Glu-tRNA(Gln) amidotransferase A subunit family amidase
MTPGSPAADSHPVYEAEDPHLAKRKFLDDAAEHVRDTGHRAFVRKALGGYYTNRDTQQARYRDWEQARDAASLAKWSAVNRLDAVVGNVDQLPLLADVAPVVPEGTREAAEEGPAEGLRGLEETRKRDLEAWMDDQALDALVFPALADVGPADADVNPASADLAWRNGVWVANGNLAIRHMGVPTVTVPMGTMEDTGMPMGLTFAGRGWDDLALLQLACAFEATGPYREPAPRCP